MGEIQGLLMKYVQRRMDVSENLTSSMMLLCACVWGGDMNLITKLTESGKPNLSD